MHGPKLNHRWFHLTGGRFFAALLAVQILLLLSERFQWFAFNEKKGWTVMIAVGVFCAAVLIILFWLLVSFFLRRPFQFRMRLLLLFVLALSVPLGWCSMELRCAKRQRRMVEEIGKMRGAVQYDFELSGETVVVRGITLHVVTEPTTPTWLRDSLGDDFFFDIAAVYVNSDEFRDEHVSRLVSLPKLKILVIRSTRVTDRSSLHIKQLTNLERMNLSCTRITDAALEDMRGLTKLESLELLGTKVTDEGMARLREALPDCAVYDTWDPLEDD
jgi:hypothetical protein